MKFCHILGQNTTKLSLKFKYSLPLLLQDVTVLNSKKGTTPKSVFSKSLPTPKSVFNAINRHGKVN